MESTPTQSSPPHISEQAQASLALSPSFVPASRMCRDVITIIIIISTIISIIIAIISTIISIASVAADRGQHAPLPRSVPAQSIRSRPRFLFG